MVRSGDTYRIADLATGTVGPDAALSGSGPTTVLARPGGGWLCICSDWSLGSSAGRPDGLDIEIETVDSTGVAGPRTAIRSIGGTSDPAFLASAQPELVDVAAIGSTDGRFAFVGWSARQGGAGWQAGIDVVDLSSATVVGSTSFVLPATSNGRPETRVAPRVSLAPSGETLLVSSFWYVEDPSPIPPSGTDHWTAPFDGRTIGPMRSAGSSAGTSCGESASGIVDASRYWVVCSVGDTSLTIERRTADGETVDRTAFPRTAGGMDPGAMLLRQGDGLFFWDPFAARLTRFDLQSGALSGATGTADVPATSPLDALGAVGRQLGRWMAPPAAAKVLLEPAIVASPDGTRIYAIGIDSPTGDGAGGSSGIYAFDARSVSSIGHWPPTADFISLAIGADGRFVYAIGQPGVDARGTTSGADASITVFDTADGSVNLIAGRLGGESLLFPGAIVR
jgi:hypothetical protein